MGSLCSPRATIRYAGLQKLYLVSDLQGRPLWFRTDGAEIDFRPVLSACADKLIELGIERPTLVFDRGGYGIQFFHELSPKADFVTWAKYITESSLAAIPMEAFTQGLKVNGSKYLVAEERRTVRESVSTARKESRELPTEMALRLVVFEDQTSGARIGIFTNNNSRPAGEIAYYMLQRWGKSEKLYKELMSRFYLNYHPGYDIEILENSRSSTTPISRSTSGPAKLFVASSRNSAMQWNSRKPESKNARTKGLTSKD